MARTESTYPTTIDVFTHATTDFNPGDAIPSSDFERLVDAIKQIETHLGTTTTGFPDELKNLVTAEIQQVENLGDVTVSYAQWGILGKAVEWSDWTPSLTGGDADLSGYDTARYYRIGDLCFFYFIAQNKNITGAGNVHITLPFTNVAEDVVPFGQVQDGTNWQGQVYMVIPSTKNYMQVRKTAAAGSWAGGETGVSFRIHGFYEIA